MSSKKIVLPGEKIADKRMHIPNTFVDGEATYAAVPGMLDDTGKYVPLEACYKPATEDVLIGVITDVRHSGYSVDLNLPHNGFISSRDMRGDLAVGDIIVAKAADVDEVGEVSLVEIRRLPKGQIIDFPPAKVPRLIGKKSSMLNLIREHSGGELIVGNNGYVWVSETSNIPLVLMAVDLVAKRAHLSGLTDAMQEFLKSNK